MTSTTLFWAAICGFFLGVFVRSFLALGWGFILFAFLLAAMFLAVGFFDAKKRTMTILLAIGFIACGCGALRMQSAALVADSALTAHLGTKIVITGVVSDEPDVRETGLRLSVGTESLVLASSTVAIHGGVLVLAPPHTSIHYGDVVRAEGTLRLPQAFDTSAGRQFNYPMYLAKDGILYELAFAQAVRIPGNRGNIFKAAAIWAKQEYLVGLGSVLPEPQSGLAGGITVGDKRSIGTELSNTFRTVGLVHVVVLSGYNITLVISAVGRALAWASHYVRYGGSIFTVIFFVLMSGGASSAVRAALMALLAMFARSTGRLFLASRALAVVCVAMLLWNPFLLAFDPSFQLSALATAGLIWFTPLFSEYLGWIPERFALREIASATLGTQLAVLPLLLYQNGQLPIFSLPANLLALVAVPIAMALSGIAAVAGMFLGSFAVPVAFPAYVLLSYIIDIAKLFAGLPFSSVSIAAFSVWWMFAAYIGLISVTVWMYKKQSGPRRAR